MKETNAGPARGFFDSDQRRTIEAAMARIIPTDERPGAREAGTIDFLDRYLSGIAFVYAKPDGSGFETLEGKRAAAWNERIEIIRQKYRDGVEALNRHAHDLFGRAFTLLAEDEQDRVLAEMERPALGIERERAAADSVSGFAPPEPALQQIAAEVDLDFFLLLVLHTRQGFLCDPVYGGNRGHVGWQAIGFPGPATMAEAHAGHYSTLPYFAEPDTVADPGRAS